MESGNYQVCSINAFWIEHIVPNGYERISSEDIAAIVQKLKEDGHLMPRACRWKVLGQTDAKASASQKYKLKQPQVASIVENVITAASDTLRDRFCEKDRRCLFECRDSEEKLSETQGATYHVDAINYRAASSCVEDSKRGCAHYTTIPSTESKCNIDTADIAASWQIALKSSSANDSILKERSVEAARHYLLADLRRTCHYSITLEATTARLWHHSRSGAAVSLPIDINIWILFTSFASERELGFDPTVTRVLDNSGQWQYQFDILHKDKMVRTYQTVKALLERCYTSPYERAMRVFEVRRVIRKGNGDSFSKVDTNSYALQDYWRSDCEQRRSETGVQRELYWALKRNTRSKVELREVWQHLMEILADGRVESKDMRGCMPASAAAAEPITSDEHEVPRASVKVSDEHLDNMLAFVQRLEYSTTRRRCRTLHAHVCTNLTREHDSAVFFFALDQATFVLFWLRRIGWLHRDISTGNLMLRCIVSDDPSSGPLCERYQLKLHDLEYALEYSRTSTGDGLVGTCDFLAVEVPERMYKFASESSIKCGSNVKFHRNFLHDLESLAWIALDFATIHVPRQKLLSETWQDRQLLLENIWQRHCALFPNKIDSWADRVNLLVKPESGKGLKKMLLQVYGEDSPLSRLPDIFSALRDAYAALESRLSSAGTRLPASAFNAHAGIYDVFRQAFREISDYYAPEEGQGPLASMRHIDWTNGKIYAHRDIKPVAKGAPKAVAKVAPKAKEIETRANVSKTATKKRKAPEDTVTAKLRRSKRTQKTRS